MKSCSTERAGIDDVKPSKNDCQEREKTRSELSGGAIILAEKLLARLPETGGLLVFGSVSYESDDDILAWQLALAIQIIGSKPTLLVQTGLPKLTEAQVGHNADQPGLTDVLVGATTLQQALFPSRGRELASLGYGTLRERTAELVMSEAFRGFIKTAMLQFHWIFVHCPSLLDERYAASLIARSHAVVTTLKGGRGRAECVRTIRDLCAQLNRPFAGVILT